MLAITTWGPGLFEPGNGHFWECVRAAEPSLFKAFNPWDEVASPAALAALFARGGTAERPSPLSRASTTSITRTGSGTWCSAPGTGPRSTR